MKNTNVVLYDFCSFYTLMLCFSCSDSSVKYVYLFLPLPKILIKLFITFAGWQMTFFCFFQSFCVIYHSGYTQTRPYLQIAISTLIGHCYNWLGFQFKQKNITDRSFLIKTDYKKCQKLRRKPKMRLKLQEQRAKKPFRKKRRQKKMKLRGKNYYAPNWI